MYYHLPLPSITIIPCTFTPPIFTTHFFYILTAHLTTQPFNSNPSILQPFNLNPQLSIPNYIIVHTPVTPNSFTVPTIHTIPTRLSPVTTKRSQSITSVSKPPTFNNLHLLCIPPLLPPKSDKIPCKRINNPPLTFHLLTFLSVNYQLSST